MSYENLKYNIEQILDDNISNKHKDKDIEKKKRKNVKKEKSL